MNNIVLIGMPGAGKSTVGVVLAKRLGYRFLDSDLVIQERYGKLLEELIEEYGVKGFWKLEEEVNASLEPERTVIATGGSAIYGTKAMRHFKKGDRIVYLKLSCEEIAQRVGDLHARGVTVKPGQTLEGLYEERTPLYEKYAEITVDCEGKAIREIVLEIEEAVKKPKKAGKKPAKKLSSEENSPQNPKTEGKAAKKQVSKKGAIEDLDAQKTDAAPARRFKREILRDKDIREPLFSFLEETYGKIRVIEEKTMGKSRADIVMVLTDAIYGIEIKSDADTYVRLQGQVKDYDKYFDSNIVVVGGSHGEHIQEHVPEHWGIITVEVVDGAFDFYFLRMPRVNPGMKWKRKMELLWRPELAQIQEWNGMPKYKNLGRAKAADKILESVPEEILARQVSEILFERDYSKVQETLAQYRKGELEKQLALETDPEKRLELMEKQDRARKAAEKLQGGRKRTYRRRRRK